MFTLIIRNMEKRSVRSAGKLHIPATYDDWPHNAMDPPAPLCSLFRMGETPTWSPLPPNCEACEIAKAHQDRMRELRPKKKQLAMDMA